MHAEVENKVEEGALVSLHFSLALVTGEQIDSNYGGPAASFRLGDGNMLPGFEEVLMGLQPGSEIAETLSAEQAFGEMNPKNKQTFPINKFQHLFEDDVTPTEVGTVVSFKDPGGFDIPGVVAAIQKETITIDFNHPLAGKDIVFKASILAVMPATVETIEVKL
ncbi:MAG: peptidylprolyl isomerase [Pseudohongiellaceae bacterium]